jgi:5'-nucleotidase
MAKQTKKKRLILVTNDDGVRAPGLKALAEHAGALGDVYVVAPATEQSGAGHSLTLLNPMRINEAAPKVIAVEGTPTDCVLLAYHRILPEKPALVFSGINSGYNLGDDITYSGTVSAAFEATLLGMPAIAVSTGREEKRVHYDVAAKFAVKIARRALKEGLPDDTLLNVNVPNLPAAKIKGVEVTRTGRCAYGDVIVEKKDPRERPYFWIGSNNTQWERTAGTDHEAIRNDKISITPIHLDLTNHSAIDKIKDWKMKK